MGGGSSTDRRNLKKAIKSNDVKAVFELLRCGVNVDVPIDPVWEHTPLILATCYGAQGVLPLLLRVCRKKDACNYEGHTALDKSIIYYSLACQFFQHKPEEIERRFIIFKTLIEGGCKRVKIPDIELWIKENKRDSMFIANIVDMLCLSRSLHLKSMGLATLIRLDTDSHGIRQILESGAGFKYYMRTCNIEDDFVFEQPTNLSDEVAAILIKASNSQCVLAHLIAVKLKDSRKSGKGPALQQTIIYLLEQVGFPLDIVFSDKLKQLYHHRGSSLNHPPHQTQDLTRMCRNVIRDSLIPNVLFGAKHLPLPEKLKEYITLDNNSG